VAALSSEVDGMDLFIYPTEVGSVLTYIPGSAWILEMENH